MTSSQGLTASQALAEKKWDGDGVPLEDSNVAGIGTEEDAELRKQAAMTEPAWEGVGEEAGMWMWRIEDFQVVPWPKEKYGHFHTKDSYIVLDVKAGDEDDDDQPLERQIYFWLGKETGIDQRGVAAYKTVELDDLFGGTCGQNREVERKESEDFLALFPDKFVRKKGGAESGFDPAQPDVFFNQLFQIRRTKKNANISEEVPFTNTSLNHRDAFILDCGTKVWTWYGDDCSPFLKHDAATRASNSVNERNGQAEVMPEIDEEFWNHLGGEPEEGAITAAADVDDDEDPDFGHGILYMLEIGEDRQISFEEVGRIELDRSMLDPTNVMVLDTRTEIFIWCGKQASNLEKRNAMRTAIHYIKTNGRDPDNMAIHMFKDGCGQKNKVWKSIFPKKKGEA